MRMRQVMYAWKRLSDGEIAPQITAESREDLFERSGFGAVNVDQPVKGYLAVAVFRCAVCQKLFERGRVHYRCPGCESEVCSAECEHEHRRSYA